VLEFDVLPGSERAKICWSLALVVASLGELRRAETLARHAIVCGREADDGVQVGYGLNALAVAQWGLGDLDAAESSRDEAIRLSDEHQDVWGSGVSRVLRARTALDGYATDADTLMADGLTAARSTGDRHLIGMAHEQLARLALRRADVDGALANADEAIARHEEIGYLEGVLGARHVRGSALRSRGDLDAALAEHLSALGAARAIDHRAVLCEALEDVALVQHARGQSDLALRLCTPAPGSDAGSTCLVEPMTTSDSRTCSTRPTMGTTLNAVQRMPPTTRTSSGPSHRSWPVSSKGPPRPETLHPQRRRQPPRGHGAARS
jgi:tetratricopeptide (TPR) repeat protein